MNLFPSLLVFSISAAAFAAAQVATASPDAGMKQPAAVSRDAKLTQTAKVLGTIKAPPYNYIEAAQGKDGGAREWLGRALTAPRDPIWVSDGVASPRWTAVSPVSGEIVPCEWKAPFDMPEQLEADAPPAPVTPAVIEAPLKAVSSRVQGTAPYQ